MPKGGGRKVLFFFIIESNKVKINKTDLNIPEMLQKSSICLSEI